MPITAITRRDVVRLLDKVEDENGPSMADKMLTFLSRLFNWHASRSDDFRSPIVRGMRRIVPAERARSRILSDNEIGALWKATERPGPFELLVRFLLLSAARKSEAANMTRDEIRDGIWICPATRAKGKADITRPLSRAALDIIAASPLSPYPFSRDGRKPFRGFSVAKRRLDKHAGVVGWTIHDLRRSARSLMSRAGIGSEIAERCLGHVVGGVVQQTYDRHRYVEEMRSAYEALATLIIQITTQQ
jgi:integrase